MWTSEEKQNFMSVVMHVMLAKALALAFLEGIQPEPATPFMSDC